jgi:hypothetical protein
MYKIIDKLFSYEIDEEEDKNEENNKKISCIVIALRRNLRVQIEWRKNCRKKIFFN